MDRTLRVLSLLAGLRDGPASTQDLLARTSDRAGRLPAIASFYRDLKRALDAGWIELVEPTESEGRGRPARLYRLSRAGRAALRAEGRRLYQFASATLDDARSVNRAKTR